MPATWMKVVGMAGRWLFLVLALILSTPSAKADELKRSCQIGRMAGHVVWKNGPARTVQVQHGGIVEEWTLPTCIEYGDEVTVEEGSAARVILATQQLELPGPSGQSSNGRSWPVPNEPPGRAIGTARDTASALFHIAMGPTQTVTTSMTGRGAASCPPGQPATTPLLAVERLRNPVQVLGDDLVAIVPFWQESSDPRLVRVRLKRADGSVIVAGATCRASSLSLPIRRGELLAGEQLSLELQDEQDRSVRYEIRIVAHATLPQPQRDPQVQKPDDWLSAAWRLMTGLDGLQLDAVSRLARASETTFGAQRLLGAVATETPF